MTTASDRTAHRPGLTRGQILDAAIALADRTGVGALSMRKVGDAVGVEAMSLYHHVANKDNLLDGMVDAIYAEIELPLDEPDWKEAMRRRASSAHEVLRRHRWATALMESRARPGIQNLRHHDGVVGILRRAGFSVELAGHAYALLDSFVYGFAIQESSLPFETDTGASELAQAMRDEGVLEQYPYLAEFITEQALDRNYDFGDEFSWGLEHVLDAIDRAFRADARPREAGGSEAQR
jgi:AcrR family transcriptional regulator